MSGDLGPDDWREYQANEIEGAKADIEDRRDHLGDYRAMGLLDGDFVNANDNNHLKHYLQGYADALDYASGRVGGIDNLVTYAIECAEGGDGEVHDD